MKVQKLVLSLMICVALTATAAVSGAETIVIKGSTTVLPIAQKVAEAYMKEYPDTKISISGGGSGNGIKALIDGTTDIADSSRFIKDNELKTAMTRGVYPVPHRIAYDCIVPVVHPSNPLTNLSIDELRMIYKGEINNWQILGGPSSKVVVISRDTSSGTYEVWSEKVMNKERVYPGALLQASNGAVVQAVASNKNAIGYIGLGYLNDEVKPLSVSNIVGSSKTTLDGTYPISRPLFMFTPGWPELEIINFINYVIHPRKGQALVKEVGFVPLYE
jgi:phosphate transport system substrate-binding protein